MNPSCPVCQSVVLEQRRKPIVCSQCKTDLSDWMALKKLARDRFLAGSAMWRQGDLVQALLALKEAIEIDGAITEARILLGIVCQSLKQEEMAKQTLQPLSEDSRYGALVKCLLGE